MTIYIVQWTDRREEKPNRLFATGSYTTAKQKHGEIVRMIKTLPMEIDIEEIENAVKKWSVITQAQVIDMINTLL